ncbi:hypothetical protein J3E61_002335 [Mycobacterium sp. OAE908]
MKRRAVLADDDAHARNAQLSWINRTANSQLGGQLPIVRIDLDRR